jgi:hypothetical protein
VGDCGDEVVVMVVVEHRGFVELCGGGDDQIRQGQSVFATARELVLDFESAVHDLGGHGQPGEHLEVIAKARIVAVIAGGVEDFESDDMACRERARSASKSSSSERASSLWRRCSRADLSVR